MGKLMQQQKFQTDPVIFKLPKRSSSAFLAFTYKVSIKQGKEFTQKKR